LHAGGFFAPAFNSLNSIMRRGFIYAPCSAVLTYAFNGGRGNLRVSLGPE
jgi:hypothetical protein